MKLLFVDEQLIDLYPSTVIAQTLQVFDPGRIGSVLTNFTSAIKVPKTFNNERVLSFLSNSKIKSDIPYTSLSCRYEENGIPIIRNARIILKEVTENEYSLNIFSGPWGFFERIQNLTMWDLDFLDINGAWTEATRDGYRNAVTGIVQALVDDGRLVQDQASSAPTIENKGARVKPPQVYYHTVTEKIFSSFGFEYQGDIFSNDIYKKLVIPLSVIYNDTQWIEAKKFIAAADGSQIIVNPVSPVAVVFDSNVKQGSDNFYDGSSEYVVANADTSARFFNTQFWVNLTLLVTGGTIDIIVQSTDYSDDTVQTGVGSGTYAFSYLSSLGHKDGDVTRIVIQAASGTPTVDVISGTFYNLQLTGIDGLEFFPSITEGYVYFNKLFERITLLDWLKEFCIRFNVQITQINNVITCNTLNYILDQFVGPDWTDKRDAVGNKIKFSFANYGRTNYLKSPLDTEFTPDLTDAYGDGSFSIPNENIQESFTVYTSIFAVTQMVNTFGVLMLQLNLEPNAANAARMPGNRLFFVREPYDFEPEALYDSVDRSDYLIGYYFDPEQEYEMSWQFFIDNFHQKFVDRCLRRVRLLERFYNLSDLDIFSFNQQVPVWDDGERFLVTKIVNYVSRKLTKVELLKIEANPENTFQVLDEVQITGELTDTVEVIADTVDEILDVQMELDETVTGNPTWETTFDNGSDSVVLVVVGDSGTDTDVLDPHVGLLSVDADVVKTNNDGNGPDGFPVVIGWVEWLRNGVQVNTVTFDSASHSSLQGLSYTYTNVKAWEVLKTIVHEDGSTP